MDTSYTFIYEPEKKNTFELIPLYLELDPPSQQEVEKKEKDDGPRVIIIEIL
jgi:hypothetical protein